MRRTFPIRRVLTIVAPIGLVLLGVLVPSVAAQDRTGRDPIWATLEPPTGTWALRVAVSRDGGLVYAAGEGAVFAYDAHTGATVWSAPLDGDAADVAVGPDGRGVYVTYLGAASPGDFGDYDTNAYDALTGRVIWQAVYDAGTRDYPTGLAVSPDGQKVFVTGESWLDASSFDYATVAYNAKSGGTIWASRYNGTGRGYDDPHAIDTSPDGHLVYVTGESPGTAYNDFATLAYNAESGQQVWLARYNSGGTRGDTAYALAVDPTGRRVFVTGCTGVIDYCVNGNFLTIAYTAGTGAQEWAAIDPRKGGQNQAIDVSVSRDGTAIYVLGDLRAGSGRPDNDIGAVAYDAATGSRVWSSAFTDLGDEFVDDAALDPDGTQVIATGFTTPIDTYDDDIETVSFDTATGAVRWSATWNGPGGEFDEGHAIAFNPAGTLAYVAGRTINQPECCGYAFVTLAYHTWGGP